MRSDLVERLRERITIGFHDDGFAMVGSDGSYENRPATPMTRLRNPDGPEAATEIERLREAIGDTAENRRIVAELIARMGGQTTRPSDPRGWVHIAHVILKTLRERAALTEWRK